MLIVEFDPTLNKDYLILFPRQRVTSAQSGQKYSNRIYSQYEVRQPYLYFKCSEGVFCPAFCGSFIYFAWTYVSKVSFSNAYMIMEVITDCSPKNLNFVAVLSYIAAKMASVIVNNISFTLASFLIICIPHSLPISNTDNSKVFHPLCGQNLKTLVKQHICL